MDEKEMCECVGCPAHEGGECNCDKEIMNCTCEQCNKTETAEATEPEAPEAPAA